MFLVHAEISELISGLKNACFWHFGEKQRVFEGPEKKIGSRENLPVNLLEEILDKYAVAFAQLEELVSSSSQSEEELLEVENKYFSVKKLMRIHKVEIEEIYELENFLEQQLQNLLG